MSKRATIADLARKAGVSVATVDRVLNRRLPVREDTALRVVAAAEAIGYHATGLLRQRMTEVRQVTLGFLLQKRHDDFYKALAAELSQATKSSTSIRGKPVVEFMDESAHPTKRRDAPPRSSTSRTRGPASSLAAPATRSHSARA